MLNTLILVLFKIALMVTLLFSSALKANTLKLNLVGIWKCNQNQAVSDSIKGKNNYALHFTADSNLAIQTGKIEIIDEANNLMSVMLYDLEFYFINQESSEKGSSLAFCTIERLAL